MLTIARLFGKSPFAPLQTHMDKVGSCLSELPSLFEAFLSGNETVMEIIFQKISRLEYEADLTKNDIRNHLPKSLFLPLDREALLEILSLQDGLADQAEKIAYLALMKKVDLPELFKRDFIVLCQKNMEVFWLVKQITKELDDLLESSFGGIEAEKVKGMAEQISFYQYEANVIRHKTIKALYNCGERLCHTSFHLIYSLIHEVGKLSQLSELLGNRIRMLLDLR